MKRKICFLTLFLLLLSACGTVSIVIPTETFEMQTVPSAISLPDLALSNIYLGMQGFPGGSGDCVTNYAPFEIRTTLQNLGNAPAYNISITEISTGIALTVGELGAGQVVELYFPATSPTGTYTFTVDPQNLIPESNESNNIFSYLAPTPTPPALCPTAGTPFPPGAPDNTSLSETTLRNTVYRSQDFGEFQMTDGIFYRTPPTSQESPEIYTTRIQAPIFYGDINLDGLQDALVVLNTQNGGTGHFMELAAVINVNGAADNVATTSLGDRVVVESAAIDNGIITLNMRVHGPDDGLCFPSQFVIWNYSLNGNELLKLQ